MNIIVLLGSPKGSLSTTQVYIHFLQKRLAEHSFSIFNVAAKESARQLGSPEFDRLMRAIQTADAVLWCFPVYYSLVPAQMKQFIELAHDPVVRKVFAGKYAAAFSTSENRFDYCAHNYVRAVSDDLDMNFVASYSAHFNDLLSPIEQVRLECFARDFVAAVTSKRHVQKRYVPLPATQQQYVPGPLAGPIDTHGKKVVILRDFADDEANIAKMTERFQQTIAQRANIIDLQKIQIRSGCRGCYRCAYDGQCVNRFRDDYHELVERHILPADVIIIASCMRDRYLSSKWKTFLDRLMFRSHIPLLSGKQIGVLVSGPVTHDTVLRESLTSEVDWHRAHLVEIVHDDVQESRDIDLSIATLAEQVIRHATLGYVAPPTFYSVGGSKIYRDKLYEFQGAIFQNDEKYYAAHGLYNVPRPQLKKRILSTLLRIPKVRRRFLVEQEIHNKILAPLVAVVEAI